jgi:D-beta-D-heptose 7-phosphate kinase/D-beta-D-heptose 1-phosphate adenosyltransferase
MARNNVLYRCKQTDEVPWVRVEDLEEDFLVRPVALINGAFDVLHSGHMKIIFAAHRRVNGGTLICALDSDERVKLAKGPTRPIQSWVERATTLGYMPVNYIVEINTEQDMNRLIKMVEPEFRVQGADYKGRTSRYPEVKKYFVYDSGMRTSTIVERILKGHR